MTAKLLQLVNSAFFGLRRRVSSPSQAIVLLGLETVKALALSVQIFSHFEHIDPRIFSLEGLWNHCLAVAGNAKRIARHEEMDKKLHEDSFMAGLLHDVGKLVFAAKLPEEFSAVLSEAKEGKGKIIQLEQEIIGASHAEVGAFLLGLWGFTHPVVEAVAFHHTPSKVLKEKFNLVTVVHVADALEHEVSDVRGSEIGSMIDEEYLGRIGKSEQLPVWRELCFQTLQKECEDE